MASIHALSESTKGLPIDIPLAATPVDVHICPASYTDEVTLVLNTYGAAADITIEFDDGATQVTHILALATKSNGGVVKFTISDGVTLSVASSAINTLNVSGSVVRIAAD